MAYLCWLMSFRSLCLPILGTLHSYLTLPDPSRQGKCRHIATCACSTNGLKVVYRLSAMRYVGMLVQV